MKATGRGAQDYLGARRKDIVREFIPGLFHAAGAVLEELRLREPPESTSPVTALRSACGSGDTSTPVLPLHDRA